jgi:hypothetical protein
MRFWDTNDKIREYSERLFKCFPDSLRDDVEVVMNVLSFDEGDVISSGSYTVRFQDKTLEIPDRLYFDEPSEIQAAKLTDEQKTILNCLFLRHHDGYLRQRRLEQLCNRSQAYIIPFTFQLLGEYVREILVVLDKHINEKTINGYLDFIRQNDKYFGQTESRMISYWDRYYRSAFRKRRDYIGQQIFDRLKGESRIKQ